MANARNLPHRRNLPHARNLRHRRNLASKARKDNLTRVARRPVPTTASCKVGWVSLTTVATKCIAQFAGSPSGQAWDWRSSTQLVAAMGLQTPLMASMWQPSRGNVRLTRCKPPFARSPVTLLQLTPTVLKMWQTSVAWNTGRFFQRKLTPTLKMWHTSVLRSRASIGGTQANTHTPATRYSATYVWLHFAGDKRLRMGLADATPKDRPHGATRDSAQGVRAAAGPRCALASVGGGGGADGGGGGVPILPETCRLA
jgi:hypothetical protein